MSSKSKGKGCFHYLEPGPATAFPVKGNLGRSSAGPVSCGPSATGSQAGVVSPDISRAPAAGDKYQYKPATQNVT